MIFCYINYQKSFFSKNHEKIFFRNYDMKNVSVTSSSLYFDVLGLGQHSRADFSDRWQVVVVAIVCTGLAVVAVRVVHNLVAVHFDREAFSLFSSLGDHTAPLKQVCLLKMREPVWLCILLRYGYSYFIYI
jgi:hypothetical protein